MYINTLKKSRVPIKTHWDHKGPNVKEQCKKLIPKSSSDSLQIEANISSWDVWMSRIAIFTPVRTFEWLVMEDWGRMCARTREAIGSTSITKSTVDKERHLTTKERLYPSLSLGEHRKLCVCVILGYSCGSKTCWKSSGLRSPLCAIQTRRGAYTVHLLSQTV